jgi:tetrahydromethanopterin S-methyltransferase subunit G
MIPWDNHPTMYSARAEYQRMQLRIEELEAELKTRERTSQYWKDEHIAANKRIAELEKIVERYASALTNPNLYEIIINDKKYILERDHRWYREKVTK